MTLSRPLMLIGLILYLFLTGVFLSEVGKSSLFEEDGEIYNPVVGEQTIGIETGDNFAVNIATGIKSLPAWLNMILFVIPIALIIFFIYLSVSPIAGDAG